MKSLIKRAETDEERENIFRFRYEIYIEEMGKLIPDVDHERRLLQDKFDSFATQLYVERRGRIAGVLRCILGRDHVPEKYVKWYGLDRFRAFSPANISFTGRMMVAKNYRNSPLAVSLIREAYRIGRENKIAFDFCHTTPPLVSFFERLGCHRYKDDFLDPDLGPRTPIVLALEDIAHLERCQSPLSHVACQWPVRHDATVWFNREFMKGRSTWTANSSCSSMLTL